MTDCWAKVITFPGCTTMLYKYDLMYDVLILKQISDVEFATQSHNGVADIHIWRTLYNTGLNIYIIAMSDIQP